MKIKSAMVRSRFNVKQVIRKTQHLKRTAYEIWNIILFVNINCK